MDTAWIQVFILTVSECVAPAGKTICQERELQMRFVDRAACELAMEHILWLADGASDVIINKAETRCAASAVERPVYASFDAVKESADAAYAWQAPGGQTASQDFTQKAHRERLASLPTCEDAGGEAPCKIGEIIIEGADEQRAEIWRSNR